jgi:hypothetical protein
MAKFKKATEIQTILFDKKKWSVSSAKRWLSDHNKEVSAVDTTKEYHRFRQRPAFAFEKGTFRTINIGAASKGIKAVIAVPKASKPKSNPTKKSRRKRPVAKPWLPSILVDLADVLSIDLDNGQRLKFPRSGKFALCANKAGTEIWIFTRLYSLRVEASDPKCDDLFEKFTGFESDETGRQIHITEPKKLMSIGKAINIVYRSDKFSAPGKNSDYVHTFKKMPKVTVDNVDNPSIVALRGGAIRIKPEGITG